jgi:hypothetical protein
MKIVGEVWIKEAPRRFVHNMECTRTVTVEKVTRRHLLLECGHTQELRNNHFVPKYNTRCYECDELPSR